MDFSLTPEHEQMRKEAKRFFEAEVQPNARAVDRLEKDVFDYWPKLAAHGYIAPQWPEEYGGSGIDSLGAALIAIELAKACGSTSLSQGASTLLAGGAILRHGTEEQKRKYLPPMARGETVGAWGLTEPAAGSDVLGIKTRAKEVDGGFVLNGSKTFITNAPVAKTFIAYAWTDEPQGHQGMSAFILERGMKGFETSVPMHKMGFRGSPTGEMFMEDCFAPKENLLGNRGMGFYEATDSLNAERAMAPCMAIGFMERALELSLRYTRERQAFGRPLAAFQAVQLKLARMYVDIELSRSLLYRLIWMRDQGLPFTKEASAAKVFCSEAATRNALEAIQVHGGYGYMEEYEVERIMRDAKLLEIGAGATDIQLLLIARMLAGEPSKEPARASAQAAVKVTTPTETTAPSPASPDCRTLLEHLCTAFDADAAAGWKARIQFDLSGARGGRFLLVSDDATCRIEDGGGDADTTIEASDETWSGILLGTLNPQKAFFAGQLKVTGNLSNAMMLSNGRVFPRLERTPA